MFIKTKVKIVVAIMSALILLWFGSHFIIYVSYVQEFSKKNYQLLKEQADVYLSGLLDEEEKEKSEETESVVSESPEFALTTFYSVAFAPDGTTYETMNDKPTVRSNEELEELARYIAYEHEDDIGVKSGLLFYHITKGEYDLVVFLDNTLIYQRSASLFRYTKMYTWVAFIGFLLVSILIANMIVHPLEKGYKNQKQFISNAGHELKTPVSVINANAEMLKRKIGDDKWLENIRYENERMGVLVAHLLELSRTEALSPKMELVDFSRLVQGEVLPFEIIAYEKGLELVSDIAPDIKIYGNTAQLKEVVSVLIDNAIQHCNHASPEIKLLLKKEGLKYLRFSVINSGDSITEEERDKIFERFYRANNSTDADNNHYGLGLAIAKNIVKSHKGKIKVWCYDGKVEFQVFLRINTKLK